MHDRKLKLSQMDVPKSREDSELDETQSIASSDPSTSTASYPTPSTLSAETCVHDLPDEILDYIFSFLGFVERIHIETVCKRWHQVGMCATQLIFDTDSIHNSNLNDKSLCSVLSRCGPSLKKLVLNPNPELTCVSLAKIGHYCPNIVNLELHLVAIQQVVCLTMIALGCPNLKAVIVQIHGSNSTAEVSENNNDEDTPNNGENDNNSSNIIHNNSEANHHGNHGNDGSNHNSNSNNHNSDESHLPENYFVTCSDMYNEGLLSLAQNCKAVEYLHVISLWTVTLGWLEVINPYLQTLILENTGFTSEGMLCLIKRCDRLKEFALVSCRQINQTVLFQLLRHFKRTLKILRITYGFDWFLNWSSTLQELVNLEILDLFCCDLVDDALMEVVAKNCVKLRVLDISGTEVTDVGLFALVGLPRLKELVITFQSESVTPQGLESLVAKGVLRRVTISPFGVMKEACGNLATIYPNVHFIVDDP